MRRSRSASPIMAAQTDIKFAQGKAQEVHDYVKAVHDLGLLAGVSAHNPENIKRVADEGWEVDYFMTCFYFVTRKRLAEMAGKKHEDSNVPLLVDPHHSFLRGDPDVMTAVARQVQSALSGLQDPGRRAAVYEPGDGEAGLPLCADPFEAQRRHHCRDVPLGI